MMDGAVISASTRIYLRPFTARDAEILYDRCGEKGPPGIDRETWLEWARDAERLGPAYSGFLGERLIGAAGMIMRPNNKADAWSILSPNALNEQPMALYRWIKRSFAIFTQTMELKKVRALVRCDYEAGCRMVEKLGFAGRRTIRGYRLYIWKAHNG